MCVPCLIPGQQKKGSRKRDEPELILANGTLNRRVLDIRLKDRSNFGLRRNSDAEAVTLQHLRDNHALRAAGSSGSKVAAGNRPEELNHDDDPERWSRKAGASMHPDHNPLRRGGSEATSVVSSARGKQVSRRQPVHVLGCHAGAESASLGLTQPKPRCELRESTSRAGLMSGRVEKGPVDHELIVPELREQPWTYSSKVEDVLKGLDQMDHDHGVLASKKQFLEGGQCRSDGTRRALSSRPPDGCQLKENIEMCKDTNNDIYFWARPMQHRMLGTTDCVLGNFGPGYLTPQGTLENVNHQRKRYTVASVDGSALRSRTRDGKTVSLKQAGVPDDGELAAGVASDKHDVCAWWRKHTPGYTPRVDGVDPETGRRRSVLPRAQSADPADKRRPTPWSTADDQRSGAMTERRLMTARTVPTAKPMPGDPGQPNKKGGKRIRQYWKGDWQRGALLQLGPNAPQQGITEQKCAFIHNYPDSEAARSSKGSLASSRSAGGRLSSARGSQAAGKAAMQQSQQSRGSRRPSGTGSGGGRGSGGRQRTSPGNEGPAPRPPPLRRSASEATGSFSARGSERRR